ncbi:MAG: xylulokinase [Ilumatobacter fluminis]|uniref:xylulokinase n=1 Tax=Ilumatobacter fluminis TaxID=467091 RepID=UPI0032EB358C
MTAIVLGIDSSTQSVKVEARRLDTGEVVASGTARHPVTTPPVSEQDPRAWWDALVEATRSLGEVRRDVVAVSVAGQQHGCVLLDERGDPVRAAKLWNDTTSAPDAAALVERFGADTWARRTGSVPVASFTISKLAWVAAHEPEALQRATRVMLPHDYLTWRLTGEHVTDRGDASGSGWYDPVSDRTVDEFLAAAVGDWPGALPTVLGPTEAAGRITAGAAAELELPDGVIVGPGTGDNMGAALGLGLRAGDVAVSLGTSGVVLAVSSSPTHDTSGAVAGFASATGAFLPLVCTLNATKVTDTVARWLGTDAPGLGALAMDAVDEPGPTMLVPYFDGERTPNLPDATGTFHGLTNATTREQLALAAHDGVLCSVLYGVEAIRSVGATIDGRTFLVGGGSRSVAYRRRCADLLGRPVTVPSTDETVAAGSAVQAAAVVSGDEIDTVTDRWRLGTGTVVEPACDATERRRHYAAISG